MDKLNRSVIKDQAKQLIKGKVFQLFIIIIVAGLISGGIAGGLNGISLGGGGLSKLLGGDSIEELFGALDDIDSADNEYNDDNFGYGDYDFDSFYEDQQNGDVNPFEEFGGLEDGDTQIDDIIGSMDDFDSELPNGAGGLFSGLAIIPLVMSIVAIVLLFSMAIALLTSSLEVTLSGYFVEFIRKSRDESFDLGTELGSFFKNTFNKYYFKKIGVVFFRGLFTGLLSLLFVIPGIMYYYSTYFAYQVICDNPELSATQALQISKKMNKGNRGELFVLDLSFIPWYLLVSITFGLATIYVSPYVATTTALFYENFRIRAIQHGVITEQEVTSAEKLNQQQDNYFNGNPFGGNVYESEYSSNQNNQSYSGQYYQQSTDTAPPSGEYYQPPTDSSSYYNNDSEN